MVNHIGAKLQGQCVGGTARILARLTPIAPSFGAFNLIFGGRRLPSAESERRRSFGAQTARLPRPRVPGALRIDIRQPK